MEETKAAEKRRTAPNVGFFGLRRFSAAFAFPSSTFHSVKLELKIVRKI